MSAHASRLPFSLDALIAEAKRRMRRRRVLVATVLVLLGAFTAAAVIIARSPGGPGAGRPSGGPGAAGSAGTSGGQALGTPFHGISAAQHPRTKADRLDPSVVVSIISDNKLQKRASHGRRGLVEPGSARFLRQLPNGARVYAVAATGRQLFVLIERMPRLASNVKPGAPLWECTSPLTQKVPAAINGFRAYKSRHKESPAVSWGVALDAVTAVSFTAGARVTTVPVKHNAWVYEGRYMADRNLTVLFKNGRTETIP
jgi:hypothetical protein